MIRRHRIFVFFAWKKRSVSLVYHVVIWPHVSLADIRFDHVQFAERESMLSFAYTFNNVDENSFLQEEFGYGLFYFDEFYKNW
jgi:hypothetical protein